MNHDIEAIFIDVGKHNQARRTQIATGWSGRALTSFCKRPDARYKVYEVGIRDLARSPEKVWTRWMLPGCMTNRAAIGEQTFLYRRTMGHRLPSLMQEAGWN
jgi:hypothetical protein